MPRTIHTDTKTQLASNELTICYLVSVDLPTALYMTDYGLDINYGGSTYLAGGYLLGISAISENSQVQVGSITITMSGVNQLVTAALLSNNFINRDVVIYRALLDASNDIVGNPIRVYDGSIAGWSIAEQKGGSQIQLTVSSHWANFSQKAGRRTNSNSQQMFFSSDKGMEYAGQTVRDIKWGRA